MKFSSLSVWIVVDLIIVTLARPTADILLDVTFCFTTLSFLLKDYFFLEYFFNKNELLLRTQD